MYGGEINILITRELQISTSYNFSNSFNRDGREKRVFFGNCRKCFIIQFEMISRMFISFVISGFEKSR